MPTGAATPQTTLLLYDRRRLVREGLAAFLTRDGASVDVCAEPAQLDKGLRERPEAAIVGIDGADEALWTALERCAHKLARIPTIGIVNDCDTITARRARKLGMHEIIGCDAGLAGVSEAVRAGLSHGAPPRPRLVTRNRHEVAPTRLTERELEVVRLISLGMTAQQIAEELGITAKTVENHKQRIYRKLDVQSQAQAVAAALRRGFLQSTGPVGLPVNLA